MKGCDCEWWKAVFILTSPMFYFATTDGKWWMKIWGRGETAVEIKYCPFCGAELKEESNG